MTRVAIIGNSHVGAYLTARKAVEAAYPSVELSFFALPRHSFSSCSYGDDGVLKAREEPQSGLPGEINLADQDHILLVGQRFAIEGLARLVDDFDVLGLHKPARNRTVSQTLLQDFLDFRVERSCRQLSNFMRDDPRCVVAPVPYLSDAAPELASNMYICANHPAADTLMSMWTDAASRYMAASQIGFMPQPQTLQSGPGMTPAHLSRAHGLPSGTTVRPADHTHMNTDYGLAHFKAFATEWLGLEPQTTTSPLEKEH